MPRWPSKPATPLHTACGFSWDAYDITRFLAKCEYDEFTGCYNWEGAKSRGRGNTDWYGSFWTKGKMIRAHKFYGVAVLGLRPLPNGEDHIDHICRNSLCVRHLRVLTSAQNLAYRWIMHSFDPDPHGEYIGEDNIDHIDRLW